MIKKFTALLIGAILLCPGCKKQLKSDLSIYENKADSILKLMMLDEKIGQVSLFTSDCTTTGPSMRQDNMLLKPFVPYYGF